MTNAEYRNRYRVVRSHGATITIEVKKSIRAWMVEAVRPVFSYVKTVKRMDDTTRAEIKAKIDGEAIYKNLRMEISGAIKGLTGYMVQIDIDYIQDAIKEAKAAAYIKPGRVADMYRALASEQVARNHADRYTVANETGWKFSTETNFEGRVLKESLSRSIWKYVRYIEDQILDVVEGGLNQGRDGADIALDLEAFLLDGKKKVAGRWGKLKPGTAAYYERLAEDIDYRALRLLRSEMYSSIQGAAKEAGRLNPACDGKYDWVLQAGREAWPCACPDLSTSGPYEYRDVPTYPHPNCACIIRPVLMEHDQFIKNLEDFVNGVDSDGGNGIAKWVETLDGN